MRTQLGILISMMVLAVSCAEDFAKKTPISTQSVNPVEDSKADDRNANGGMNNPDDDLFEGVCGDGVINIGETCDDGENNGGYDACTEDCLSEGPHCGDGVLDPTEECDGETGLTCAEVNGGTGQVSCNGCRIDVSGCAAPPPVLIITEIMNNPKVQLDADGEWFEIYNASGRDVNIGGCVVSSARSNGEESFVIAPNTVVRHSAYFVFANSSEFPGTPDYNYQGAINLANTSDYISIHCEDQLIDSVAYDNVNFPRPDGASLNLNPSMMGTSANDHGAAWCLATSPFGVGDRGTPGAPNDACN